MNCIAQISFDSVTLEEIYNGFGQTQKKAILEIVNRSQNTRIDTLLDWNRKILTISIDKGMLQKLGIEVKNLDFLNGYDSIIRTFIERVLLRLSFDNTIPGIVNIAKTMQISFFYQEKDLQFASIEGFNELLYYINNSNKFRLTKNENLFVAEWNNEGKSLKMIFPNNYQLLIGKNKKELDEELLRMLGSINIKNLGFETHVMSDIYNDSLPLVKSEESVNMDLFTSKAFFKSDGLDSILIFEPDMISFSVKNLFLEKGLTGNRTLKVNQFLYGGRLFPYTLTLNNFISCFKSDFLNFIGLENEDPDQIEGTVIYYHKYFNFIHLLHFKTDSSEVFNDNGNLTANFYTNIPMHNVSNPLMDYMPEDVKEKIEIIIKEP